MLSAATHHILCLVSDDRDDSSGMLKQAAHKCALAVQALCLAMLSFGQAHVGKIDPFFLEHSLSHIILRGTEIPRGGNVTMKLVNLACVGSMIDSKVMAFTTRTSDCNKERDVCIPLEDLLDLWGPGDLIPYQSPKLEAEPPGDLLYGIAIRGGILYRPSRDSSKLHWKAGTANDMHAGFAFKLDLEKEVTIGAILVNQGCPTERGRNNTVVRTNISSEIKELGTWPAKWDVREKQAGLSSGQFVNATFNTTWIKTDSRTRKTKGLEAVDLDFLSQPWGLLVSVCNGVSQRVTLLEMVAEVMSPMMDAWMEKTVEWQTLMSTGEGLLEELKKPTFRDWFIMLNFNVQHAFNGFIRHILRKICWTGVNDAGKLVVACPQHGNLDACIHLSLKSSRAFTWLLKDTERSATFACLTNACFIVEPWLSTCQHTPHPQWQNQVSALITSVCQYQWLGADDWVKLPRKDLQNLSEYWMGTSEDKRKVTIQTHPGSPPRLTLLDSPAQWRFLRRAWERIERLRQSPHIELRESSLMTESHAMDVVIVRG
jgi:hypothetical protein